MKPILIFLALASLTACQSDHATKERIKKLEAEVAQLKAEQVKRSEFLELTKIFTEQAKIVAAFAKEQEDTNQRHKEAILYLLKR